MRPPETPSLATSWKRTTPIWEPYLLTIYTINRVYFIDYTCLLIIDSLKHINTIGNSYCSIVGGGWKRNSKNRDNVITIIESSHTLKYSLLSTTSGLSGFT